MAIYLCTTPTGPRLVNTKTPLTALLYAMGSDGYKAESINATHLAVWLEKGLKIETVPEPVKHAKVA